jgi:hypothetical protein
MKKKIKKYIGEEENPSQFGLTWRTYNPSYEIMIKKNQTRDLVKKNQSSIKKI